jgi:site-specific DNA-methyltransferase (adenine-specific)
MSQLTVTGENYTLHLADCMDLMAKYPDGHFDLAVVDPPYGAGNAFNFRTEKTYQNQVPSREYFEELRRVSKHQIVWGGNYFELPCSRGWIVWNKHQPINRFSDGELAWTSFDRVLRIFDYAYTNVMEGDGGRKEKAIHPTQKPVGLYSRLLQDYAAPGMKVLDTHLGSGSSVIAAHYAGIHLTACEIDPEYFAAATARIERETMQTDFIKAMTAPLQPEQISFKMEGTP